MVDAAVEATGFIQGKLRSHLDEDRMLVLALARLLEIIGEAASNVSAETRAGLPEIDWQKVRGMRNRIIHAYFDVDVGVVWDTTRNDLPVLIDLLGKALGTESGS